MARRVNVIIREINGEIHEQLCNQEGKDITELSGDAYEKQVRNLIERTVHRKYGPNGAAVIFDHKASGKDAGYQGYVGHKAWGKDHLFNDGKQVVISLRTEDGKLIVPADAKA
jgi:hypothetical protein